MRNRIAKSKRVAFDRWERPGGVAFMGESNLSANVAVAETLAVGCGSDAD